MGIKISRIWKGKLSSGQIKACRQNLKTKEIIIKIRSKLDAMLSDVHPPRGDLMEKALNHLNTFWTQLFAYIKDGCYTIDNSIAERFIRPLSGGRKNSLFFGSGKMVRVSAAYHTIISTCKMQGVSVLQYFKIFFQVIVHGRRDYENLLPMTIGLGNDKL
ncbi:IS66 family transposase [Bacteroides sp. CG01]|uniref:IS66 family transposase n=1 Tax=Bacteroides sp. CG01 TaxID=3096000 RepID=UPI002AFE608A|nr:transposase [Bacteroides sp. CG01]